MDSIAVLIACHNRKDKTLACLKALMGQDGYRGSCQNALPTLQDVECAFNIEVYLVDDLSTDGTSDAVTELYPTVHIIKGNGHLYWNRGMHLAWQEASQGKYDYFFWLNDDTNLKKNALNIMLSTSRRTKNMAIVCGAIEDPIQHSFSYGGRNARGDILIPDGTSQECFTMNGNAVLVSDIIFAAIGNLDPVYPHAIGDIEYALRAKKKGISVVTTPEYIGYCANNPKLPLWCYSSTPILKRIRSLYSPLGNSHPYYFFRFERKYYGLSTAIKHSITIHLRAVIPSLWRVLKSSTLVDKEN